MVLTGFRWFLCFGCFVVLYLFLFGVSSQCQDLFLFGSLPSLPSLPCSVWSILRIKYVDKAYKVGKYTKCTPDTLDTLQTYSWSYSFISLTWLNGTREDQWTSAEKAQLLSQCVGLRGNRSDLTVGSCRA